EESQFEDFIDNLEEDVKTDPDGIFSRLICPRKLEPDILYHAFLIPSYETGRLAGLERSTTGVKAQQVAWPSADSEFPVYYRWHFRTGQNFDFEYLVKQLEPRVMDERVGIRPMDCSKPGFVQADSLDEVSPPEPKIILLEGAMKAPTAKSTVFPPPDTPQPFFKQVEKLVNLNRFQFENTNEDPFVSVPYYGMYHATKKDPNLPGKKEIPEFKAEQNNWYNDLNRDPRTRVPAGFGVRVVQDNQEKFMDRAWKQLGDVLEANKKMQLAQFTCNVSKYLYKKTIEKRLPEDLLRFTQPVAARILAGPQTVKSTIEQSILPNAIFQGSFSRVTRKNTSLVKGLDIKNSINQTSRLVREMNKVNGLSSNAKQTFKGIDQLKSVTGFEPPANFDTVTVWSKQSNLEDTFIYNVSEFKGGLPEVDKWKVPFNPDLFKVVLGSSVGSAVTNVEVSKPEVSRRGVADSIRSKIDSKINVGDSVILKTRIDNVDAVSSKAVNQLAKATYESAAAQAFNDVTFRYQYRDTVVQAPVLQIEAIKSQVKNTIDPSISFKKLIDAQIKWPEGIFKFPKEDFLPAMAYPDIPEPAYKHLVDIDKEFLLPNLHLIPNNTLSLLRTNQKFIEAYLMGLNYEMGRELLWREYPTDMRGSYFRQFWDVSGFVTPNTTPKDADSLKDIRPIHTWLDQSNLGRHNARDAEGDAEQLVFVIRGELLKKFPNTVIYAQKAFMRDDKKVIHEKLTPEEYVKEVRFPLYQAEIGPDIKLLGFDLTIEEAAGIKKNLEFNDSLGWFFVIAEVPGEPHFGMDVTYDPDKPGEPSTWDDLSWENFGKQDIKFIKSDIAPGNTGQEGGNFIIPTDALKGIWGKSSADMAALLFQKPVMVAVHATEMLDVEVPEIVDKTKFVTLLDHIKLSMIR
ncbi:MAG: hypothetical protein ICV66_06575, partial [Chitinophagaceae bacterium]|nr:hypothetical protein [Chitinophagaceae bacterium]